MMRPANSATRVSLALLLCGLLQACGDDPAVVAASPMDGGLPMYFQPAADAGVGEVWQVSEAGELDVPFDVRIGPQRAACGGVFGPVGSGPSQVEFRDLRFYVSDAVLIQEDGRGVRAPFVPDGDFQSARVALLDFEDRSGACAGGDVAQHRAVRVVAPAGRYVGMAFTVGVPAEDNHGDVASADPPLDRAALFWSWLDGHKFMRLDTTTTTGIPIEFHLGSTACSRAGQGTRCSQGNRPAVHLLAFDPARQQVVLDYGRLVSRVNLEAEVGGCIAGAGSDVCNRMLAALGLSNESGIADASTQTVFRVEDR